MSPQAAIVPGGKVIKVDVFEYLNFPKFHCAVLDPAYGRAILNATWNKVDERTYAGMLLDLATNLQTVAVKGAHLWLWGGIGTPGDRILYRSLLWIEETTRWQMAEQITWKKKRAYGTDWRCLMNREECLRFVLGNPKEPYHYEPEYTADLRGYAGFNEKHPAKSAYKRRTMIWDHASDMGKKEHECYKPGPLAKSQILSCTRKGDTVLDLFAGSGEVSIQARELGRKFIAFENDPTQFKKLVDRLSVWKGKRLVKRLTNG